jgi:hypothetical protein
LLIWPVIVSAATACSSKAISEYFDAIAIDGISGNLLAPELCKI